MIACVGLGKMGAVLAERLVAAGYDVCGFDISPEARLRFTRAGGRAVTSSTAAIAGADAVVLCLPDAAAVEQVVLDALASVEPLPALWVDCTSSLPAVTRRVGERLRNVGSVLVDAPVTGGVVGAREGTLTAMVGGDPPDYERARSLLECFAARVLPAGPLGSGHAVKAINNALSSAALIATAEIAVAGRSLGYPPEATIEQVNRTVARSQNSEVKYPRDVLPGRYESGFTIGLMRKDVATACELTRDLPLPLTAVQRALWRTAWAELGPDEDFTRVYELVVRWSGEQAATPVDDLSAWLCDALAGVLAIAARESLALAREVGLDRIAALAIVNVGSGRNEFTRLAQTPGNAAGRTIADALDALDLVFSAADVAAPISRLAAELLRGAAREFGRGGDLAALVAP